MNMSRMQHACVLGYPVAQSLSPQLHNYWYEKENINAVYDAQKVSAQQLHNHIKKLSKKEYVGCNITIPHKEAVFGIMDDIDEMAQMIGAVNTVVMKKGRLFGTNTDAYGFIENLKYHVGNLAPYMSHALVLGAGGAARAVIAGLQSQGCRHISITNRTLIRAEELAMEFGCEVVAWEEKEVALKEVSLLVNTTSLGMKRQQELEIDLSMLSTDALVADIVYKPLQTRILKRAQERGNLTVQGLGMLLFQAQKSVEHWFGLRPEINEELFKYMKKEII